jgi:diadenosine tetraphosphate (Ap4A) HIT family hydrolase
MNNLASTCKYCKFLEFDRHEDSSTFLWDTKYTAVFLNPHRSPHLGRTAVMTKLHITRYSDLNWNQEAKDDFLHEIDVTKEVLKLALNAIDTKDFRINSLDGHMNFDVIPAYKDGIAYFAGETFKNPDHDNGVHIRSYSNAEYLPKDTVKTIVHIMQTKIIEAEAILAERQERLEELINFFTPNIPKKT